jgi:hypothetical protein
MADRTGKEKKGLTHMATYSEVLKTQIEIYLKRHNQEIAFEADDGAFYIGDISIPSELGHVNGAIFVGPTELTAYCLAPVRVNVSDAKQRLRVMEYLTRANYGLALGNFEMDLADGEIRFKSFLPSGMMAPPMDVIASVIEAGPLHWGIYGDGLLAVMAGKLTPRRAIADVEMDELDEELSSDL